MLAAGPVGAAVLLELGAILLGLAVVGQLALRAGISPVPLYLLGGLAFGTGGLVPLESPEEFIEVGAEIGVLLLLLMLGLEYSADELVHNLRAHAPAGVVDVVLNALPGLVAGLLLGWSLPAALALAGVTWISSSGVVAKTLSDLGRLGNRETPVVLSVLVIEDLAMAVYLPVLGTVLAGVGLVLGGVTVAVALLAVTAILVLSLRFGGHVSRLLSSADRENLLLRLLGVTLLVAGVAQQAQVSAAVGAFLVGIALSGEVAEGARELLAPLRDLFAAVFFVFFGLQTDPREIPGVALVALVLCAVTAATKVATGWYAAARAGVATRGRLRAGTALVARGEFSVVIAGLAVSAGVEPGLGPLAAAYVLFLAVAGPVLTRFSDPLHDAVAGRRAAAAGSAAR
ncbi:MAG TPA: cation:proton antiporter [Mycobacteriales bacterium]|nr:cation:proton antiporter [Mycobacteriales bacterium]